MIKTYFTIFLSFFCIINLSGQIELNFQTFDSLELQGTLLVPDNGKEKHPLVVFMHGSGPNDRDQTFPVVGGNVACLYPDLLNDTIRNFKDIAEFLADNGYATFRFDKRSFTYQTSLNPQTTSPQDFMNDVHSAIDLLKERNDIDTNCISLAGHSKGATFIPYVALDRSDIKNMIFLTPPSTPIDTLFSQQIRELYFLCLNDTLQGNNLYNQSINAYLQIRNNTLNPNTTVNGAPAHFWKDWINLADSTIFYTNQADLPSLYIFGDNDFNVPPSDGIRIENELTTDFEIHYFDNTTHFLTDSINPVVKTEILNTILNWLEADKCDIETKIHSLEKEIDLDIAFYGEKFEVMLFETSHYRAELYDMLGKKIFSGNFNERNFLINKPNPQGVYILYIQDLNNSKTGAVKIRF